MELKVHEPNFISKSDKSVACYDTWPSSTSYDMYLSEFSQFHWILSLIDWEKFMNMNDIMQI